VSGPGARLKKPAARLRTVDDPSKAGIAGETSSLRVEEDESEAFLSAVAGARRLEADLRVDAPAPALGLTRAPVSEDMEALAALSDLVSGDGHFDISDSTEYVEEQWSASTRESSGDCDAGSSPIKISSICTG